MVRSSVVKREVGIVVIGRNEGYRLIDCLTSLRSHTGGVVYVDSGSEDESVTNAKKFSAVVVQLGTSEPYTAARARNEGFAVLTARFPNCKYVQFIDGDCRLAAGWLGAALSFIASRDDVAVVCGRRRELYPERSVYNRLCDIEWNTPVGEASACGGDALMRVEAFQAVSGFSSRLIAGEEPELCARLREEGWKIWRIPAEMTCHDAAMVRFDQWWRRAIRSGYAEAEISSLSHARAARERRATMSAVFWAGLLPIGIVVGALMNLSCLAILVIYPVQIARVAARSGFRKGDSWVYALFVAIAKFAQLQGALLYCWRSWRKQPHQLIEYKSNS